MATEPWVFQANLNGNLIIKTKNTYLDRDIKIISLEDQFKQDYICLNKTSGSYTILANSDQVIFTGSIINPSNGQVTQPNSPILPQPAQLLSGYRIIGITGMELVNNSPIYFKECYLIDGELYVTIHNGSDIDITIPEKSSDEKNNSYIKVLLEKVL